MKIVYSTRPYLGHLYPFVPLGRDLYARGNEVAVASGPELIPAVDQAGFTWLPAGLHPNEALARFPAGDSDYGIETVRVKVNDLLEVLMNWYQPQVLIREPTDLAAAIAAEVSGVASISLGVSHFIPVTSWSYLAAQSLQTLRREYRLPPDPALSFLHRGLYLDTVPPSFEEFAGGPPRGLLPISYRSWDGDDAASQDLVDLDDQRSGVLVSLGTVYNDEPKLLKLFMAALDQPDLRVICTTGAGAAPPATLPANVQVVDYAPHSALLPHCRVLLCHGGFNTVMGALALGVPVVCVPLGADQYFNAERCEALGAGVRLEREGLTPSAVRAAVRNVLDDPSYAAAAEAIRAEIEALPGPETVSVIVEQFAATAVGR